MLERAHASLKKTLKIKKRGRRSMWHKYVNIAVLKYNTFYHTSIGCEPSKVFHGRVPYIVLDFEMGIRPNNSLTPYSQIAEDVLKQTVILFQDVRKTPCKRTSSIKLTMTRKPMPQN